EQTLAFRYNTLGPQHPDTLRDLNDVAEGLRALGRHAEAIKLHEVILGVRRKSGIQNPYELMVDMESLAREYRAAGQIDKTKSLLEEPHEFAKSNSGPTQYFKYNKSAFVGQELGQVYLEMGLTDRALPLIAEYVADLVHEDSHTGDRLTGGCLRE